MDEEQTLYFLDGVDDLPYIEANDWLTLLGLLYKQPGFPVDFEMSTDGELVTYSRYSERYDDDISMIFDFDNNTYIIHRMNR